MYTDEEGDGQFTVVEGDVLYKEALRERAVSRARNGFPVEPPAGFEPPPGKTWVVVGGFSFGRVGGVVDGSALRFRYTKNSAGVTDDPTAGLVQGMTSAEQTAWLIQKEATDADWRTLPVLFDMQGDHWRRLDSAVSLFEKVAFQDFPVEGPRSSLWVINSPFRRNHDFASHHTEWVRLSEIRADDRAVHEPRSICRALQLMLSDSQLNVCNIVGVEQLVRRMTTIETA
jgi:hypothetical protein